MKEALAALGGAAACIVTLFVSSALVKVQLMHFGFLVYLVPAALLFGIGYLFTRERLGLPARLKHTRSVVYVMIPWVFICTVFFAGDFQMPGSLPLLGRVIVYSGVALVNWWLFRGELEKERASI